MTAATRSMTFQSIAVSFWSESANSPRPPRASMASLMSRARRRLATSAAGEEIERAAQLRWHSGAKRRASVILCSQSPYCQQGLDLIDEKGEASDAECAGDDPSLDREWQTLEGAGEPRECGREFAGRCGPTDQCRSGDEDDCKEEEPCPVFEAADAKDDPVYANGRWRRRPDAERAAQQHPDEEPPRELRRGAKGGPAQKDARHDDRSENGESGPSWVNRCREADDPQADEFCSCPEAMQRTVDRDHSKEVQFVPVVLAPPPSVVVVDGGGVPCGVSGHDLLGPERRHRGRRSDAGSRASRHQGRRHGRRSGVQALGHGRR